MSETVFTEDWAWTKEFEQGHELYDEHHKKFLEIINFSKKVIKERSCEEEISLVFFRLIYYVENCFIEEEIRLRENAYPVFKNHREEHNQFIKQIVDFQQKYKAGDSRICSKLLIFLQDWFDNHILMSDRSAAEFLLAK
jgi:hemerythrin-like metal-binding protein